MGAERREAARVPVGFYVHQMIDDTPVRGFATNLSSTGLYVERVLTPLTRMSSVVQIELPLPGVDETVWAKAEVVYDCFDQLFHGTAFEITGIAGKHERLLSDWLTEQVVEHTAAAHQLALADFSRASTPGMRQRVVYGSPKKRPRPRRRVRSAPRTRKFRGLWHG